jgi:PleD family two-component response regulator
VYNAQLGIDTMLSMDFAAQPPSAKDADALHSPTVLVVDDDIDIAQSLAEYFQDEGYEGVTAGDGLVF